MRGIIMIDIEKLSDEELDTLGEQFTRLRREDQEDREETETAAK